ncbi:hypothetical protein CBS101457_003919 [Exobasidium rhododendri]|nr:hypothetical protein CBS101457_003919 [Exobasidium rhododendri]
MTGETPTKTATTTTTTTELFSRNLGRGKACRHCRKRKLRCDGARPVCARCQEAQTRTLNRLRRKGASDDELRSVNFPSCFSGDGEDEEDEGEDGEDDLTAAIHKASGSSRRITADEGRKDSKQRRLNDTLEPDEDDTKSDLFFAEILSSQLPIDLAAKAAPVQPVPPLRHHERKGNSERLHTFSPLQNERNFVQLPSDDKIRLLFQVFFEDCSVYAVFQPAKLLARLAKGSEHEDYPHPSAIHAILAMAYAERPDLDDSLDQTSLANARVGAHYMHAQAAQKYVSEAIHFGESSAHYFDVTRALMLLCVKQYGAGDVLESYMSNAASIRACISMNLNKEVNAIATNEHQLMQQNLRPRITDASFMTITPRDAVEAEEVRRTMSVAYTVDRTCCASTLWPGTLCEEDYTASLPRTTIVEFLEGSFSEEIMNRPARYLNSPDFFTHQTPNAEELYIKGTAILGKCAEFLSRLPRDATKDYIVSLASFQRLENSITILQLSMTALINSIGGPPSNSLSALSIWLMSDRSTPRSYDVIIVGTATLPHACSLTLHEPFANISQESEAICKGACRSVIAILRLCSSNGEPELARLHAFFIFVCSLVGRSLIRQMEVLYSSLFTDEFAQNGSNSDWDIKDFTETVSLLQADLEVILLLLKKLGRKWPIGMKQYDTLLKLLQFNPEHRLRGLYGVSS